MTPSHVSCKWRKIFFYLFILTRGSRPLLRFLCICPDLSGWKNYFINSNGYSFSRLRSPLGPNIILRGHCHYQSVLSYSLYRWGFSSVNMRRIRCRQCNFNSILFATFYFTICCGRTKDSPSIIFAPNW